MGIIRLSNRLLKEKDTKQRQLKVEMAREQKARREQASKKASKGSSSSSSSSSTSSVDLSLGGEHGYSAKAKSLSASSTRLQDAVLNLETMLLDIFQGTFVHRYRDTHPQLRVDVLTLFGAWCAEYVEVKAKEKRRREMSERKRTYCTFRVCDAE